MALMDSIDQAGPTGDAGPRWDSLVRLRTAAVRDSLQRAKAGDFTKEHKTPRRWN